MIIASTRLPVVIQQQFYRKILCWGWRRLYWNSFIFIL